jgi:hypothetical protein
MMKSTEFAQSGYQHSYEKCLLEDELKGKLFSNGSISSEVDESSVDKLKGSGSMACGRSETLSTMKSEK